MAGLGRKTFNSGDVLNAADVQGYLMDQAVMVFAGTAARGSAIPSPSAGMVAYSTATQLQVYNGTAWVDVSTGYGVATGGASSTAISVGGVNYTLLTFTSSGTLTVTKSGLFDFYAFGGGASGGSVSQGNLVGGGGGAGGGIISTLYLDANQTITIGGGGSGSTSVAGNGTTTTVGTKLFATGGGVGAFEDANNDSHTPQQGGCGGGAFRGGASAAFETGATGQIGFKGGDYSAGAAATSAAGGGGMGAVGVNCTSTTVGSAGGAGVQVNTFIGGSSLFKAGGGGGAGSVTGGAGGSSIGGAGYTGVSGVGTAAGANTASGGGGSIDNNTAIRLAGNGGSGIVYVRFRV